MRYPAALERLGLDRPKRPLRAVTKPQPWSPPASTPPPDLWAGKAAAMVKWCAAQLHSGAGADAISYLRGRGLAQERIKAFGLGWVPSDMWRARKEWGLEEEAHQDGPRSGKPKRLWIPAGLVIPTFGPGGEVVAVKIRRWEGEPRYYRLPGSANRCLVAGNGSVAVVVESELDALLIAQVAGDLVTAVALGSAQAKPDAETHALLDRAPLILQSNDHDDAGVRAAWGWWRETYRQFKRWPVPEGKDPTEAHQAGIDLRLWIEAGILSFDLGQAPAATPPAQPAENVPDALEDVKATPRRGVVIEWPANAAKAEPPQHDNTVRCGDCQDFEPGTGDPVNALGHCSGRPGDNHQGQWPAAPHVCAGFTTKEVQSEQEAIQR